MSGQMDFFNDNEVCALGMALAVGQRERGFFTDEESDVVFNWARKTLLHTALLELVLDGTVLLSIDDNDEIRFRLATDTERQEVLEGARAAA